MLITDRVTLGDIRVDDAGYLETFAHTARTGVQQYRGAEAGRPDLDVVNVYRDEAEVFSRRSLDTFAKIPVTVDHPAEPVTAVNWKRYAVGTTGEEVLRDGERLKIGLKITDAAAVQAVKAGKRELSVGYTTELVWGDGVAPDGTPYQARQTAIAANHIAIVAAGRAGPQCRIGDSWSAFTKSPEPQKEPTMSDNRTVMVDGLSVLATDQSAQAIEKLLKDREDARKLVADAETAHKAAIATKDEEIGKLKTELQQAKDAAPKPEQLDKLVADRAALVMVVKTIDAKIVVDGKSDAQLRKEAVAAKLGADFAKDASDAEIVGMFKTIAKDVKPVDPVRQALAGGLAQDANSVVALRDKAMNERLARFETAYLGQPAA